MYSLFQHNPHKVVMIKTKSVCKKICTSQLLKSCGKRRYCSILEISSFPIIIKKKISDVYFILSNLCNSFNVCYKSSWLLPFPTHNKSAADNIDNMLAKIWNISGNESIINEKSWKYCGKRRKCSLWAISPFVTMFSKSLCCNGVRKASVCWKGTNPVRDMVKHIFALIFFQQPFPLADAFECSCNKQLLKTLWQV